MNELDNMIVLLILSVSYPLLLSANTPSDQTWKGHLWLAMSSSCVRQHQHHLPICSSWRVVLSSPHSSWVGAHIAHIVWQKLLWMCKRPMWDPSSWRTLSVTWRPEGCRSQPTGTAITFKLTRFFTHFCIIRSFFLIKTFFYRFNV